MMSNSSSCSREHVLGGEKAFPLNHLEISERERSKALQSHLYICKSCGEAGKEKEGGMAVWLPRHTCSSSDRRGQASAKASVAFLDLYSFKTKVRRCGLAATWRCLTITLQTVFTRNMEDVIFAHFC